MTFSPCFPTHGTHLALLLIFLIFIPVCSLCRYLECRLCLDSQISNLPSFLPGQTQGAFSLWIRPSDALRPVWLRFKFFICSMNPSFVFGFVFFFFFSLNLLIYKIEVLNIFFLQELWMQSCVNVDYPGLHGGRSWIWGRHLRSLSPCMKLQVFFAGFQCSKYHVSVCFLFSSFPVSGFYICPEIFTSLWIGCIPTSACKNL